MLTKGIGELIWLFLKNWWWVPLPLTTLFVLKYLYLYWRQNVFWGQIDWILLELKTPRDVERPIKAMEQVISNFWTLYDPPDFKEKWFEGKFLLSFELEIVGIDGAVHFFLRIPKSGRKMFESAVYSQYPDVEITEVEDYTKNVPQDIPNKDWDLWGCDFKVLKNDCYPIKTYLSFFEPSDMVKEEKRIDPLAVLIEGMTRLKKGEQLWFQMRLKPVAAEFDWVKRGKEEIAKLVHRPGPSPEKSITGEAINTLLYGTVPFAEEEKKQELIPPEMRLTTGERDIVSAIENKISKNGFQANIRMIYLGERTAFFKPNLRLILNFSVGLSTQNFNGLQPKHTTKVVPPAAFRQRKLYMKKKQLFRRYVKRWSAYYPFESMEQKNKVSYALNTEEVATMFHFPSKTGVPTPSFTRIEAKKSGPPSTLPVEG